MTVGDGCREVARCWRRGTKVPVVPGLFRRIRALAGDGKKQPRSSVSFCHSQFMRLFAVLSIAAGIAFAATSYTATNLRPAGSTVNFANMMGLNNQGEVLGDAVCSGGCFGGANRGPAVWSNGVITPLPIPAGYSYIAVLAYYGLNDSGTVVGTLLVTGTNVSHVVVWTNGVPAILPDAPIPAACSGSGCQCSTGGSSTSFGINTAGHIVGSTTYPTAGPAGSPANPACSATWIYNGSSFRVFQYPGTYPNGVGTEFAFPVPAPCTQLAQGYYPGVGLAFGASLNDADVSLHTLDNFFCGPPFLTGTGFPAADPFVIRANGTTSFLALGTLAAASAGQINDLGDVLGSTDPAHVIIWDGNGVHDLGPSGYAHLNNVGQVVYLDTTHSLGGSCYESGCIGMWQNGVSSTVQLPVGLFAPDDFPAPGPLNDAGQFVAGDGANFYLLSPSGPCAQDVTSQVQITRSGFRYNRTTGLFALIGSVTNTSGSPIPGPISLVVDNLSTNASLYGISGDTLCAAPQGSPYTNIGAVGEGQTLAPGAAISGAINFIDSAQTGITYSLRVLAGPGGR